MNTAEVRRWMRAHTDDHTDRLTGEVNLTALAEEAAMVFDLHEDDADFTIPEEVFDLAFEVAG